MTSEDATAIILARDDSGLNQDENTEKSVNSEYILNVETTFFADRLFMGSKRKKSQGEFQKFDLCN